MNFDINNSLGSVGTKATKGKAASPTPEVKSSTPAKSSAKADAKDQVVLSQEAQTLGRLQAKINTSPDVNLEKVEEIKRAIAEGRFEINADRIAENMLNQDDLLA